MKISPTKTISIIGLLVIFIILIIMYNGDMKKFDKIRTSYLNWYFRSNPVTATWIGIHTYDAKLPFNRMEDYVQDMNKTESFLNQLKLLHAQIDVNILRLL